MTELQTELLPTTTTRPPVNLRSFSVGLAGVLFVSILTPYNDFVAGNTMFIGNYLPISVFMFFLFFLAAINAPLRRWAPSLALDRGELAVAMGMMLVGCCIPGSGLMRYLPSQLVAVWYQAGLNTEYARLLNELNLPSWLFPTMESTEATQRATEDVVQHFLSRVPIADDSFWARWIAVPWRAWVTPALVWTIPVTGLLGAILCMSVILRKQWVENERLAFPLATVYLSLIEEPERGKTFNKLFSSRGFLIAFFAVFLLHSLNALHIYNEKIWPEIKVSYNITKLMSEPPWSNLHERVSTGTLYFSIIGVALFLQTKVSFSLWCSFAIVQALRVIFGPDRMEMTVASHADQTFGMLLPFSLSIFWIGRRHWMHVVSRMFRKPSDEGRYLPYFFAGWGLIFCMGLVIAWLCVVGMSFLGATFIVCTAMIIYLTTARIVAETGLPFIGIAAPLHRPWLFFMQDLPSGLAFKTSLKNYFFTSLFGTLFTSGQRENLQGYAPHAIRIADTAAYEGETRVRGSFKFVLCLIAALVIAYVVAGASTLYCEYSHFVQLSKSGWSPLNTHSVETQVKNVTLGPPRNFQMGTGMNEAHSRWMHIGIGAGGVTFLSIMRFWFASWPFHPIGYMMCSTYVMQKLWLSILCGWLIKVLIVRFGGASMMMKARPIFIGLIVGESAAAGFWVAVSLVRIAMGLDFEEVRFLPG